MPDKYKEGDRLRCVEYSNGSSINGRLVGCTGTVFRSVRFGLGIRFDGYTYLDAYDHHSLGSFIFEHLNQSPKKMNLCSFLRRVQDKEKTT